MFVIRFFVLVATRCDVVALLSLQQCNNLLIGSDSSCFLARNLSSYIVLFAASNFFDWRLSSSCRLFLSLIQRLSGETRCLALATWLYSPTIANHRQPSPTEPMGQTARFPKTVHLTLDVTFSAIATPLQLCFSRDAHFMKNPKKKDSWSFLSEQYY